MNNMAKLLIFFGLFIYTTNCFAQIDIDKRKNLADEIEGLYKTKSLKVKNRKIRRSLSKDVWVITSSDSSYFTLNYLTSTAYAYDSLSENADGTISAYFRGKQIALFRSNGLNDKQTNKSRFKGKNTSKRAKKSKKQQKTVPTAILCKYSFYLENSITFPKNRT